MAEAKAIQPNVQHTTEYNKFKVLAGNRVITPFHVQEIVTSFQENPSLVELRPILVNENMEIIDGQHRLRACEVLGIPVPYIVAPGLDIATAQLMNALQRPWTMMDFAHSYANMGNPHYQKFLRYLDDYSPLKPSLLLQYINWGTRSKHNAAKDFRLGRFEFPTDTSQVDDRLGKLTSFADFSDWWHTMDFANAFAMVLRSENYDHERMLKGYAALRPARAASRLDELRTFEKAYNFNIKTDANIVRFF